MSRTPNILPTINVKNNSNNTGMVTLFFNNAATALLSDKDGETIIKGNDASGLSLRCPLITDEGKRIKLVRTEGNSRTSISITNEFDITGVHYLEENEDESYSIGERVDS